jgi:SET domain-containing protein
MQLNASMGIDAMNMGNSMRFINHSCDPNAELKVSIQLSISDDW